MGAVIARPPLPPGPFLVLGLARSGVAAARALTRAGSGWWRRMRGRSATTCARRCWRWARRSATARPGWTCWTASRRWSRAPGCRARRRWWPRRCAGGITVIGELELGWRLLGEHEFIALTGSNGKTTTVELIGHIHRVAGVPVVVAGNVGTALTSLPGTLEPGAVDRLRGLVVPARGHARASRPTPRSCSTCRRITWTATAPSRTTAPPSWRSSPTSRRARSRSSRRACALADAGGRGDPGDVRRG